MSVAQGFSWQANLLDTNLMSGSRRRVSFALIPTLLIGLLIIGILGYSHTSLKAKSDLRSRADQAEQQLAELGNRLNTGRKSDAKAQQQQAENLEAELGNRLLVLKSLNEALARDQHGWSAQAVLHTLSEQHNEELWLTKIRIDRVRHEISLEGIAANAHAISQYITRLGADGSALSRMAVGNVESDGNVSDRSAAQTEALSGTLRFKLNSKGGLP